MAKPPLDTRSSPAAARTPTVLVVDGDRVSRRFVELALKSFVVESVNDAAAALEVLKAQLIDLIVCETMLGDMSGLRLFRRLREESRLRAIPFVFLSSDARVETKVIAFRAGVDDYLVKPCDAAELAARAHSWVGRAQRALREGWHRSYTLAGDFSAMAFPDLVASIDMSRRSGVLSVLCDNIGGQVYFESGRAVHARFGNLVGVEAFFHCVWATEGQFEFTAGHVELAAHERTLSEPATVLVMEAARRADTARHVADGAEDPIELSDVLPTPLIPSELRVAGPVPEVALAAQYEMALRDPFSLGDLKLLGEDDLAKWTLSTVGRDRLHIVLIASLEDAISAILPLAGAPTERSLIDSLEPGHKALALAFFLKDERLLDLVLLDARAPSEFLSSLRRIPSVLMLAPPAGDFMALGTQSCAVLRTLIDSLDPIAVMGVGLPTLEDAMTRMGIKPRAGRVVRCLNAILGEPSSDFRHLLVQALRLWTAGGRSDAREPSRNAAG